MTREPIKKILLIEDNSGDARLLQEMLKDDGHHDMELTLVVSMREAEEYLAANAVDLILLDPGLPDAIGLEAVQRAHAAAPRPPLVVLTGLDDELLARRALQEGAQDYLIKNEIEPRGLVRALRYSIERAAMQQQLAQVKEQLYQAQKMEAVGQLTGGIAHDFNNLLAIIVGSLDLIAERLDDDQEGRKFAERAITAGLRGGEMTRKLLAFSRRQVLETKTVDFNAVVHGTIEMLRRSLGEKIEIIVRASSALWSVDTDQAQLESALVNLAVNARDSMPDGGQLTIETENSHLDTTYAARNADVVPGDYVMLSVTDTGTGILPENLDRVIEPFFTTKEVGKGSGLGLSMIYGFARQSGGHFKLHSTYGQGTSARLYLPRGSQARKPALTADADEVRADTGELILVVDDSEDVRTVVVAQLKALGYRTIEAADGASAIALLKTTPRIDMLLTDMVMPGGLSGIQLGDTVRQLYPAIGILYTSGFTDDLLRNGSDRPLAGVHLLMKPYRKHELARTVRDALPPRENGYETAYAKTP
jgi:signal transduction histidine kinase